MIEDATRIIFVPSHKDRMSNWTLSKEQLEAVQLIMERRRALIWWKVGEGKTRIALEAYVRLTNCRSKLLVVCSPQAFRQWQDEADLHPFGPLMQFQFVSYGALKSGTDMYFPGCEMVVLDELWLYKNPKSQRSIAAHRLTSRYKIAVGLSGSLVTSRNIEDIYGQSKAIGLGSRVARSLTDFRTQFCVSYEEFGLKWTARKGALETVQKRLAPFVSLHFPKDIRESRLYRTTVDASAEQIALFDTCQTEYYAQFKDGSELEIRNAAALIVKLQQISDGSVLNGEGQRVSVKSTKLQRLLGILEDLADGGERAVIWFAFKASLDEVYQILGKKATALSSDHAFDSEGWRVGKYQYTLATVGSGASLNDFSGMQYSIIYSAPFSHRAMQQAMGRTNRTGSPHSVCYYNFLQTAGGIDDYVYDSVARSASFERGTIKSSVEIVKEYMRQHAKLTGI